jgi:hypothetical protein
MIEILAADVGEAARGLRIWEGTNGRVSCLRWEEEGKAIGIGHHISKRSCQD